MKKHPILSVDDSEDDNFLLQRAFRHRSDAVDLHIVHDGQEAIDYLMKAGAGDGSGEYAMPELILLDLKMPRKDGFAVLQWLREQPNMSALSVAVLTSSQSGNDIRRAYEYGAQWYLVKPVALEDLGEVADAVERWLETRDPDFLASSRYWRASEGSSPERPL